MVSCAGTQFTAAKCKLTTNTDPIQSCPAPHVGTPADRAAKVRLPTKRTKKIVGWNLASPKLRELALAALDNKGKNKNSLS